MALFVALLWVTFSDFLPTQTEAYTQPDRPLTLEESIEQRAEEIFEEKKQDYMEASRIYAMLEYQKQLEYLTSEIGYND